MITKEILKYRKASRGVCRYRDCCNLQIHTHGSVRENCQEDMIFA